MTNDRGEPVYLSQSDWIKGLAAIVCAVVVVIFSIVVTAIGLYVNIASDIAVLKVRVDNIETRVRETCRRPDDDSARRLAK